MIKLAPVMSLAAFFPEASGLVYMLVYAKNDDAKSEKYENKHDAKLYLFIFFLNFSFL
jgi:hypothetical protein